MYNIRNRLTRERVTPFRDETHGELTRGELSSWSSRSCFRSDDQPRGMSHASGHRSYRAWCMMDTHATNSPVVFTAIDIDVVETMLLLLRVPGLVRVSSGPESRFLLFPGAV